MIEVQDIFKKYGDAFRCKFRGKISPQQYKALWHIEHCRTEYMGGHIDECDSCGEILISYNSCGDRHCPKCQFIKNEKWLEARMRDFLPIQYFHVIFTIPDILREITLNNQKKAYNILFKSVSEALNEFSSDNKYLGAQTGFIAILHTWSQTLIYHPHIHCIVTGGGLSYDKNIWINARSKFLYPWEPLAKLFKGKFLAYLQEDNKAEKYTFNNSEYTFKKLITCLYKKKWKIYLKDTFENSERVFKYLANYTHRIAISNHRIIKCEDDKVYFKWRDNSDGGKKKIMCLDALEFIRRFLLHVLPHNYFRIRHYGLFANRNRKSNIEKCRIALQVSFEEQMNLAKRCQAFLDRITDFENTVCPFCQKGKMVFKKEFLPHRCNSP